MCVTYQFGLTRTTAVIVVRYLSTGRMCGNLNRCQRPKALHDLHVQNSSMRSKNFVFRCTSPCVGRNISMIPVDGGTTKSKAITPQFASVQKVYFRLFIKCLSMLCVWLMGVMRDNGSIDRVIICRGGRIHTCATITLVVLPLLARFEIKWLRRTCTKTPTRYYFLIKY